MADFDIPEHGKIEYKSCSGGRLPQEFWESVAAFSNLEGGTIICGVGPDGNSIGLNADEIDQLQRAIQSDSNTGYNHQLFPLISYTDGVLHVQFPEVPAALKHIYHRVQGAIDGARVRVGSANEKMSSEWLRRFAIAAQGGAEAVVYRVKPEDVVDSQIFQEYLALVKTERKFDVFAGLETAEIYRKLRVVDSDGNMTLFGMLAFGLGQTPQEIIGPNAKVSVTVYSGVDKVDPVSSRKTSVKDEEFRGSIQSQFDQAFPFILLQLPTSSRIEENGRRVSYRTIPDIAIREALANAIAHRDYSVSSSNVQVDVYSDRVEFISPGRSLVPLHELASAPSETRNPVVMNFLKEVGVTEHRARGIRTILSSTHKAGLLEPNFQHRSNSFVATLYTAAELADKDTHWLSRFDAFRLTERQKNAMVLTKNTGEPLTNQKFRDINHMNRVGDDARARAELNVLVSYKLLEPSGEKKHRTYSLGPLARN